MIKTLVFAFKIFCVMLILHGIVILKWQSVKLTDQTTEKSVSIRIDAQNIVRPRRVVRRQRKTLSSSSAMPKFNQSRPLAFIHIGKSGGTSMDFVFSSVKNEITKFEYVGNKHFDYGYITRNYPSAQVSYTRPNMF